MYSTATTNSSNWDSGIIPTVGVMYAFTGITIVSSMNTMTYPITLFALNNIGNIVGAYCCIGGWTAYNNGEIVMGMIPVRKNGVGYMYDKVSGQLFGNAASSGAFTFGSDVTSNGTNSLNLNNGLLGSINGDEPNDEPNEIDPIAMEDM